MKYKNEILEHLYIHTGNQSIFDISKGIKVDKELTTTAVVSLRKQGFLTSAGGTKYVISDQGKNHCVTTLGLNESDIEIEEKSVHHEIAPDTQEMVKVADEDTEGVDSLKAPDKLSISTRKALDRLESKIVSTSINNFNLKEEVLLRLILMLDDSISAVLDDILADLQAANYE